MAYVPSLHRVPCSPSCTCRSIPPDFLRRFVVFDLPIMDAFIEFDQDPVLMEEYDAHYLSEMFLQLRPVPRGVIFKMP